MGIGQGIALRLAEQGASVALHYSHSATGAREAVSTIEHGGGDRR
jgi:NAD(P)-dependent dehydrogenase (short-subunit alcohol dehydrogenase family)